MIQDTHQDTPLAALGEQDATRSSYRVLKAIIIDSYSRLIHPAECIHSPDELDTRCLIGQLAKFTSNQNLQI